MRNLLALFALAVIVFAAVGWYLGWYSISSAPAKDGHRSYQIDLNSKKISQDLSRGTERLQEALDKRTTPTEEKDSATSSNRRTKVQEIPSPLDDFPD